MSRRSDLLVETDWLAEHLHDPDLRVLECTVYLHPADVPGGYRVESGRGRWEQGHIPGAGFADLPDDLSDRRSPLRFTLPPADQFAARHGRLWRGPGGAGGSLRPVREHVGGPHLVDAARLRLRRRGRPERRLEEMDAGSPARGHR